MRIGQPKHDCVYVLTSTRLLLENLFAAVSCLLYKKFVMLKLISYCKGAKIERFDRNHGSKRNFAQRQWPPDLNPLNMCESILPFKARTCSMSAPCQDLQTAIVVGTIPLGCYKSRPALDDKELERF